jgi:hypothetical protein
LFLAKQSCRNWTQGRITSPTGDFLKCYEISGLRSPELLEQIPTFTRYVITALRSGYFYTTTLFFPPKGKNFLPPNLPTSSERRSVTCIDFDARNIPLNCMVYLLEKRFGYSLPSSSPPLMGGGRHCVALRLLAEAAGCSRQRQPSCSQANAENVFLQRRNFSPKGGKEWGDFYLPTSSRR